MFSPCQFQVYISIGTLESDLLSQSTTKWTLVYLLRLYSTDMLGWRHRSVSWSVSQLVSLSVSQSASQSFIQSVSQSVVSQLVETV